MSKYYVPKYIIFDRDGTLIEHVHYLKRIEQVKFVANIDETLQRAKSLGFHFGIISNQSIIERGFATHQEVNEVNQFIVDFLSYEYGIDFDFVRICPHVPSTNCKCRKPEIGLIESFLKKGLIETSESYMVGDQYSDVVFGKNAGLRTVLITSESKIETSFDKPDFCISRFIDLIEILELSR